MTIRISVDLKTGAISWSVLDQNGNALTNGTAATLVAASTAAIASMKALFTSQSTALTGYASTL